jgi:hypothetical protein
MMPFQQAISNQFSRLFTKHNIKTIHIMVKKNSHVLRPVKDKLDLKATGIYCVPCECSKVCVGQTGRFIENQMQGAREIHMSGLAKKSLLWWSIHFKQDITWF